MIRIAAIGDVHAEFGKMWRALRHAGAANEQNMPTQALRSGRLKVVILGDLVHPKTRSAYTRLTGLDPYDHRNPDHLRHAAKVQMRGLVRIKNLVENSNGNAVVLRGNHDQAIIDHRFLLGNASGIEHAEFDPKHGGVALPESLAEWVSSFPLEYVLNGVHFAHVGPAPWLQEYDEMFYHSKEPKQWWFTHPEYLIRSGHSFGVYGHTVMKNGIRVFPEYGFALIDALDLEEYLELVVDGDEINWQVIKFARGKSTG